MTYKTAIKYLKTLPRHRSSDHSPEIIDRIRSICDELKVKRIKVAHICGETGMLECVEMLSCIMDRASYKLGYFDIDISDHPENAILINRKSISVFDFADIIKTVSSAYRSKYPDITPYFDEVMSIATAYYFSLSDCDLILIKKPLDKINTPIALTSSLITVITPIISISSENINVDSFIKKGVLEIVSSPQHKSIHSLLSDACALSGCRFTMPIYSETSIAKFSLFKTSFEYMGKEFSVRSFSPDQIMNAITAIEAARAIARIGLKINDENIEKGILDTRFIGKCEVISIDPNIMVACAESDNEIDSLISSLAQIKDQLGDELTVYTNVAGGTDENFLSSKLSLYKMPNYSIIKIHYEYATRREFDKQLEEILTLRTSSEKLRSGSAIFIGSRQFTDRARIIITNFFGNR